MPAIAPVAAAVTPPIAPPRNVADVGRFVDTLTRRFDKQPSLATIAPLKDSFTKIQGFVTATVDEVAADEQSWAYERHMADAEKTKSYFPGREAYHPWEQIAQQRNAGFYDKFDRIEGSLVALKRLADTAQAAGPTADVLTATRLVNEARRNIEVLKEVPSFF